VLEKDTDTLSVLIIQSVSTSTVLYYYAHSEPQ